MHSVGGIAQRKQFGKEFKKVNLDNLDVASDTPWSSQAEGKSFRSIDGWGLSTKGRESLGRRGDMMRKLFENASQINANLSTSIPKPVYNCNN